MSYRPTIVVDDDNKDVLTDFSEEQENCEVNIVTFETWDKTEQYLKGNNVVDGIVLDARGQLTKDDDVGDEHITEALIFVRNTDIPYVIYTAHSEEELRGLRNEYRKGRVLDKAGSKKKSAEDVIIHLKDVIAKSPIIKLRNKYDSAFKPFYKGIIGKEYEHNLIEVLFCLEDENYKKKNLNVVRDLLESVYLSFIDNFIFIPETFKNHNNKPNLEWCTRFLEGRPTNDGEGTSHNCPLDIPEHIQYNLRFLKNLSSAYSHINENAEVKNAFISATHSVLEVLEWLPEFIDEHFN